MRIPSLRLFVPLFLAASSVSIPAAAYALPVSVSVREAVSAAGLYRLTFSAKDRRSKTVHMVVRDVETGMSGMLLDKDSEAWVTDLRIDGNVLTGKLLTNEGLADLTLTLGVGVVTGTLQVDGKLLMIDGDRSN